jgi:hypothetical protein
VLAVVLVFLLAATGNAHMYGRFWVVPLHLATALLMVSWSGPRQPATAAPGLQRGPRSAAQRLPLAGDQTPIPREPR